MTEADLTARRGRKGKTTMTIHELRIKYFVPEMFHPNDRSRDALHAIICDIYTVKGYVMGIYKAGYKIAGFDERFREENKYMSAFDGWAELKGIAR